jgi:hypothetical protein
VGFTVDPGHLERTKHGITAFENEGGELVDEGGAGFLGKRGKKKLGKKKIDKFSGALKNLDWRNL